MITRVIWTFKNNEMAPASSRSTACVAPAARPVVLQPRGRAAPIAAAPNCHRMVRVLHDREDRAAANHFLHPRASSSLTRGNLARSQLGNAAPLFDATADRWIVPPSTTVVDTGAAAELRHIHNAAHKRPAVVPQTQAAGRLHAVVEALTVAAGLSVFGAVAFLFLVLA